ncbi:LysR family transcriptional regulator [Sphingobium sp.]|uniref:LysR family transcriptional regulator n=1 Tax=Sphingobium sp. TaxID=1912891 RepID=UPI003BB51D1C
MTKTELSNDSRPPSWNGIDLTTLRLLLAACEEGNLAKASARENIALSALSKRIKLLEDRFEVDLLQRHDRGVRPTATANLILPKVQGMFALLDQIAADLRATSRGEMGLIRVQAHMTAMSGKLVDTIGSFLRGHPKIDVELDEATSAAIVHAVNVGMCDIGLVSGTVAVGGLQHYQWAHDELVVVLPRGHPLAEMPSVAFSNLLCFPFIGMQRDSALLALYREKAAELGVPLSERTHVTSFEMAKKMVRNGLGVTVIPATSISIADNSLETRPLDESWARRSLILCVRGRDRLSSSATLLLDFLRNASTA